MVISKCIASGNYSYDCVSLPFQAPVPCEEMVVHLEAEIQGLKRVINNQQQYIQELHNSQVQQLEKIPNSHLGPENLYRGMATVQMCISASLQLQVVLKADRLNSPICSTKQSWSSPTQELGKTQTKQKASKILSLDYTCK